MNIVDVEFRYVAPKETSTKPPKLQYRKLIEWSNNPEYANERWTDWQDVPTVEE